MSATTTFNVSAAAAVLMFCVSAIIRLKDLFEGPLKKNKKDADAIVEVTFRLVQILMGVIGAGMLFYVLRSNQGGGETKSEGLALFIALGALVIEFGYDGIPAAMVKGTKSSTIKNEEIFGLIGFSFALLAMLTSGYFFISKSTTSLLTDSAAFALVLVSIAVILKCVLASLAYTQDKKDSKILPKDKDLVLSESVIYGVTGGTMALSSMYMVYKIFVPE